MRRTFLALLTLAALIIPATWRLLAMEVELTQEQLAEKRTQAQQLVADAQGI